MKSMPRVAEAKCGSRPRGDACPFQSSWPPFLSRDRTYALRERNVDGRDVRCDARTRVWQSTSSGCAATASFEQGDCDDGLFKASLRRALGQKLFASPNCLFRPCRPNPAASSFFESNTRGWWWWWAREGPLLCFRNRWTRRGR